MFGLSTKMAATSDMMLDGDTATSLSITGDNAG